MLGERPDGSRILFCIEWKYTESYKPESLAEGSSGATRINTYDKFLRQADCPFSCPDIKHLMFEPYYQLMRQTLLSWQMVKNEEYGTSEWINIHIIPKENLELRNTNTSPFLRGRESHICMEKRFEAAG